MNFIKSRFITFNNIKLNDCKVYDKKGNLLYYRSAETPLGGIGFPLCETCKNSAYSVNCIAYHYPTVRYYCNKRKNITVEMRCSDYLQKGINNEERN